RAERGRSIHLRQHYGSDQRAGHRLCLHQRRYHGGNVPGDSGPNSFQTMTNNPKFPNSPDLIAFLATPNWAQTPNAFFTAGNQDNYSLRMKGWIVPSASGNYTFGVHADDGAMLRIATDGNPASLTSGSEFHGSAAKPYLIYAQG